MDEREQRQGARSRTLVLYCSLVDVFRLVGAEEKGEANDATRARKVAATSRAGGMRVAIAKARPRRSFF